MSDMQPTAESGGASVTEQLEAFLAAGEAQQKPEQKSSGQAATDAPESTEVELPESDAQEQEDGPQFALSDVAKVLGVEESALDVDEDGSLKIKTKVDGKEGAAKLQDLLKSYQLQGHVDERVRKAAEQEKALSERASQFEQHAQAEFHKLNTLAGAAHQLLMQEHAEINWDRLVEEDPIGYQTKRHAFEQRAARVQNLIQAAEQQRQQYQQASEANFAHAMRAEFQRLRSIVPEWSDEKAMESERKEMVSWLKSKGASEQAISGLMDAGLVAALRAGYAAERSAPKVAAIEKKVRAAPKLVKPGQATSASERGDATVRGLKENIRKSGGKTGIAEYLIATGRV